MMPSKLRWAEKLLRPRKILFDHLLAGAPLTAAREMIRLPQRVPLNSPAKPNVAPNRPTSFTLSR
jgi:hypothetical protein